MKNIEKLSARIVSLINTNAHIATSGVHKEFFSQIRTLLYNISEYGAIPKSPENDAKIVSRFLSANNLTDKDCENYLIKFSKS